MFTISEELASRVKAAERETDAACLTGAWPYVIRLDGCGFSKYTRGMRKPLDERLDKLMVGVTEDLVGKFSDVNTAYTASDEITLVFRPLTDLKEGASVMYGGRIQKMASIVSGYASSRFATRVTEHDFSDIPGFEKRVPYFDARVIRCNSDQLASDCVRWRHKYDTFRNGVSAMAQSLYSHKTLHRVGTRGMLDMLEKDGISLDDIPARLLYGTVCKREKFERDGATRSRIVSRNGRILQELNAEEWARFICHDRHWN